MDGGREGGGVWKYFHPLSTFQSNPSVNLRQQCALLAKPLPFPLPPPPPPHLPPWISSLSFSSVGAGAEQRAKVFPEWCCVLLLLRRMLLEVLLVSWMAGSCSTSDIMRGARLHTVLDKSVVPFFTRCIAVKTSFAVDQNFFTD